MNYNPKNQGGLDSLCSVYSIINAYGITMNATDNEQQKLFNDIIAYLSKKRILKDVIIGGVYHKHMVMMLEDVVGDRIPVKNLIWKSFPTPTKRIFWNSIVEHLSNENNAVILSMGGRRDHLSSAYQATDKSIKLLDSNGMKSIRYKDSTTDTSVHTIKKFMLYPSQCWFLSKE